MIKIYEINFICYLLVGEENWQLNKLVQMTDS